MTTGAKIRHLRKESKITQEELAERLGLSYMTIRGWEAGKGTPNSQMLPKIAGIFNVSQDELLSDEDDPNIVITATSEQHTTRDEGLAEITLGNGQNFKVPATPEGFAFLKEIYLASLKNTAV